MICGLLNLLNSLQHSISVNFNPYALQNYQIIVMEHEVTDIELESN